MTKDGLPGVHDRTPLPPLPCPTCREAGRLGRIGDHRTRCRTCNSFAQAVLRSVRNRLKARYPEDYAIFRFQAECDIYPSVIEGFRPTKDGTA